MKSSNLLAFGLLFSQLSFALASEEDVTLPLECHSIPEHTDSLCIADTASPSMPVNDVVFYRQDKFGHFVLLEAIKGDVAHVFIKDFSKGGKYTVIGYAVEGHPSFIIYETDTFLAPSRPVKSVAVISNYFITNIVSLDDKGNAILELMDLPSDIQSQESCIPSAKLPQHSDTELCHISYSIYQHSSPY